MEKNVSKFDQDVVENNGYIYTRQDKLSFTVVNQRFSDAILTLADVKGKRVVDLGCGDGTYTVDYLKLKPAYVLGVDASKMGVKAGQKRTKGLKNIKFKVMDIYNLSSLKKEKFDVAILRGILHHLDDVTKAIESVSKIAPTVIVLEPNGYNPILKIIEKVSPYHLQHEEKSYPPFMLRRWFENNNGKVVKAIYCNLVPIFSPNWLVKFLKIFEPIVEKIPFLRQISCGVFAFKVTFK